MTFGPDHYVPVLKAKRGEKRALHSIAPSLHALITPLVEVVEIANGKTLQGHLKTTFGGLAESVQPYARCFLDPRELGASNAVASDAVFRNACQRGIVFTPVTGISRGPQITVAIKYGKSGVALRLTRHDLESGGLRSHVTDFMSDYGLEPANTDLIVDLGGVEDLIPEGVARLAEAFLNGIPNIRVWRTLTLSSCAFPLSMRVIDRDSFAVFDRSEWLAWKYLYDERGRLARLPTFSDCAIQRPEGVEGFDFRYMEVSAVVRYALSEEWLLIKGQSTSRVSAKQQFPSLATRLVYGHLARFYSGVSHCEGCRQAKDAADGSRGFGSAEVWRRLGTIHHITTVMEGLKRLSWP